MPTYSYKCTECGNAFDIVQAFTDESLTACPKCGGRLRKLYSAVGVTFNGSGFYRTDSRAGSGAGSGAGSASSPKSDSASSSGKDGVSSASTSSAPASSSSTD